MGGPVHSSLMPHPYDGMLFWASSFAPLNEKAKSATNQRSAIGSYTTVGSPSFFVSHGVPLPAVAQRELKVKAAC